MKFFSKSTGGFYDSEFHGSAVPQDAVEVSDESYLALFAGQANGQQIVGDGSGHPVLVDAVQAATYAELRASEYPRIGDQLDALFHAGVFPAEMAAQIQAVKDKYPKGQA